ncbi:MAG: TonB-dependent receptor [Lewinellaceae bacterium]|nr:TonB-dependent receptor [Lewinellaceae bacterium]
MQRNFTLLFTLLLFFQVKNVSHAQPYAGDPLKGLIKGIVIDEGTQQPLDYATVTLYNAKDSSMVTGTVTNAAGTFSLEVNFGSYYAVIDFISYKDHAVGDITISRNQPTADIGVIALQPDATTLQEVEVRAEKSQMQLSLDKKVFNVGKDLANTGGNAADVLDNVPSVTVDVEGNVNLRGSGGVRILVNGKPSGLVGISNSDGLRNIPANLIERIEVITNPSARYEAEGMAGIINIILKKEKENGLNGSFDISAGYPHNHGVAANLNYRRKWLNLFASYGLNYRRAPGGGSLYQEYYDTNEFAPDTTYILKQNQDRKRGGLSNNIRLGSDFFLSPNSTLTTSFNFRPSSEDNISEIEYRDYLFNLDNLTNITLRQDNEDEEESNLEYSLAWRRQFEGNGHELVAEARYQDNLDTEKSTITESYYTPEFVKSDAPDLQQRSYNQEGEKMLILQLDYVRPINKEGKFEVGYRSSFRNISNDFYVEEFANGQWDFLSNFTNEFIYNEDIHAAYAIFGNKFGRFSFQFGVRAEYSDVRTELLQTKEVNPRDYLNLFPSGHLNYELPGQNAIQLSYSRRINRPSFWSLNPFFSFSDARNFYSGNPNLNPEFTHAMELGHIKYWDNASLTSSVYYRYTEGVTERIRTVDADGNTFTRPVNLSTEKSWGAEATFSYSPIEWMDLDGNVNVFRSVTEGQFEDQSYDAEALSMFGRLTSKLSLWKKVDSQIRFNYRAPRNNTQGKTKSMSHLDLAFSKDVFDKKGSLTLSINDVFNSRRRRYISEGPDFYSEGDFQWRRGQQVRLTLNYRLNQDNKRNRDGRRGEYEGGDDMGGF